MAARENDTHPLTNGTYDETEQPIRTDFGPDGPQPGTAAYTAFLMAQLLPTNEEEGIYNGFWDDWKEDMKEGRL